MISQTDSRPRGAGSGIPGADCYRPWKDVFCVLPVVLMLCCVLGCPQAPESNSSGTLNSSPKTLRGLIAQRLIAERTERAELAAAIAADIRSGKLKEPAQYGEAWNKGDAAIGRKTSEVVSGLLKQAFAKAPHDKVWDEVGKSYR